MFVVLYVEHMRDSSDDWWAKPFHTLEQALKFINSDKWWPKENHSFELYRLGEKVEIEQVTTTIPQPSKEAKKYQLVQKHGDGAEVRRDSR